MKAVYRSIKPYWLYLILIGKKTIEVGKTFPKADDWNKEVFLNCSKDMKSFNRIPEKDREWMRKYLGKCACRFVCNDYSPYISNCTVFESVLFPSPDDLAEMGLTLEEFNAYGTRGKLLYGWHISDLVIYDEPRELSEFYTVVENEDCGKCRYYDTPCENEPCNQCQGGRKYLAKPPQSWCYVESEDIK